MSDLARRAVNPDPDVPQGRLHERIVFARALADAGLLPAAYRKRPADLLLAMELADALGIRLVQAVNGVHVIDGKPSMSADLMLALVRRAGHQVRVTESTDERCTVVLTRRDDPGWPVSVTWTVDDARRAGLLKRGTWQAYPRQMLRNRAVSEVCRLGANDVLAGVIYTAEELEPLPAPDPPDATVPVADAVTAPGAVGTVPGMSTPTGGGSTRHSPPQALEVVDAEVVDDVTGETVEDVPSWHDIREAFTAAGYVTGEQRLDVVRAHLDRPVDGVADLTPDELRDMVAWLREQAR